MTREESLSMMPWNVTTWFSSRSHDRRWLRVLASSRRIGIASRLAGHLMAATKGGGCKDLEGGVRRP